MNELGKRRKRRSLKTTNIILDSGLPRLVVHRSSKHMYAQIVVAGELGNQVVVAASTRETELRSKVSAIKKVDQAKLVGELLAKRAVDKGLIRIAFDRAGYKYHGRVRALADAAREAGLDF